VTARLTAILNSRSGVIAGAIGMVTNFSSDFSPGSNITLPIIVQNGNAGTRTIGSCAITTVGSLVIYSNQNSGVFAVGGNNSGTPYDTTLSWTL
jgi:hypothetical protein